MIFSNILLRVLPSAGSEPVKLFGKETGTEEASQRPLELGKYSSGPGKECSGPFLHLTSIRMKVIKDPVP